MADVALAGGFGSMRRFNDAFRVLYGRPAGDLRRDARDDARPTDAPVRLQLPYRAPYDWEAMLNHLRARALDGWKSSKTAGIDAPLRMRASMAR